MTTRHTAGAAPETGATASGRARQRVGRVTAAFDSATGLRRGMNLWPPFLLTGIHIDEVSAEFRLDPDAVAEVRAAADSGATVLRWFEVDVVGGDGAVVARVRKQLDVRRAPAPSPRTGSPRRWPRTGPSARLR